MVQSKLLKTESNLNEEKNSRAPANQLFELHSIHTGNPKEFVTRASEEEYSMKGILRYLSENNLWRGNYKNTNRNDNLVVD